MKAEQLWKELRCLFETDDGSLPEIRLSELSPDGVVAMFSYLQNVCDAISDNSSFWSIEEQNDKPIDSVPNAAALVIQGLAEPFHCLCQRPAYDGVVIPDLGVFVFADQISLDYRMGREWNPTKLKALFGVLKQLKKIFPAAKVDLEDGMLPEMRSRFERVWKNYLRADSDC